MFNNNPRFAFHAEHYSPEVASNRLRLFKPMHALQKMGIDVELYGARSQPDNYDAIIFSRGFSARGLGIARAAQSAGTRIVLDMCDNLFALAADRRFRSRCERLRDMIGLADVITAPTEIMARQLQAHVPEAKGRFRIVPDTLETFVHDCGNGAAMRPLAALSRFHDDHPGALHCVWYGSSAGTLSGLAHLHRAAAELAQFQARHPVTLTVISDTRLGYWLARRGWAIPSFYLPFKTASFGAALARHHVAVIPVAGNCYTSGKSINRAATAVMAGLGVIADPLKSYEELRPWIALDDWQGGLARYAARPPHHDPALIAARRHLEHSYGAPAVAARWADVLAEAVGRRTLLERLA